MIQPSVIHLAAALIGAFAVVILALAVFLPQAAAVHSRSETRREDQAKLSSLAARVPISDIRDGLIVRRDGSFCAGWECSGVATEFADAERLEALAARSMRSSRASGTPKSSFSYGMSSIMRHLVSLKNERN